METTHDGASNPLALSPAPCCHMEDGGGGDAYAGQPVAGARWRYKPPVRFFVFLFFFDESLLALDEDKQHMSPPTPPSRRTRVTAVADAAN